MLAEYSRVILQTDRFSEQNALRGMVGYVIHVYPDGNYEVEFSDRSTGISIAQIVAAGTELQPVPEEGGVDPIEPNGSGPGEVMNRSTMANLLSASEGEFSYSDSPADALVELALQDSDAAIATSALGEWAQRDSDDARQVACAILSRVQWDAHLTAYALTVLYSRDPQSAFGFMQKLVDTVKERPVFEALIDNVLSDPEHYEREPGQGFVRSLLHKLEEHASTVSGSDEVATFKARTS